MSLLFSFGMARAEWARRRRDAAANDLTVLPSAEEEPEQSVEHAYVLCAGIVYESKSCEPLTITAAPARESPPKHRRSSEDGSTPKKRTKGISPKRTPVATLIAQKRPRRERSSFPSKSARTSESTASPEARDLDEMGERASGADVQEVTLLPASEHGEHGRKDGTSDGRDEEALVYRASAARLAAFRVGSGSGTSGRREERGAVGGMFTPHEEDGDVMEVSGGATSNKRDSIISLLELACGLTTAPGKLTPLEQQVVEIKKQHPTVLSFVECGYRYRFFGEDAQAAAPLLNIVCHPDKHFMTASIPTFRLHVHVSRLVNAGYMVGVVTQTETAALKKASASKSMLFTRALSSVYTRATYISQDVSEHDQGAYVVAISESMGGATGLVAVHAQRGDIVYDVIDDDDELRSGLAARLAYFDPSELVLPQTIEGTLQLSRETMQCLKQFVGEAIPERISGPISLENDRYCKGDSFVRVWRCSPIGNDEVQSIKAGEGGASDGETMQVESVRASLDPHVLRCLASARRYLAQFGLEGVLLVDKNFRSYDDVSQRHVAMARNVAPTLDLLESDSGPRGGKYGSLLYVRKREIGAWVLDHTMSAFGARLMKEWISRPLFCLRSITERHDAIEELVETRAESFEAFKAALKFLTQLLQAVPDLERLLSKISYQRCSTKEFVHLLQGLQAVARAMPLEAAKSFKSSVLRSLHSTVPELGSIVNPLLARLNVQAALDGNLEELFITPNETIQEHKDGIAATRQKLDEYLLSIRRTLRKPSLEYITKLQQEYLVQVTVAESKRLIPGDWECVSSTKQFVRYHPPYVKEQLEVMAQHQESLTAACMQAWDELVSSCTSWYAVAKDFVVNIARLDCLLSLADVAVRNSYVRPRMTDEENVIEIEGGRHPIVEHLIADPYVPNNTCLGGGKRALILTGPNMGGKSSYIKQVALIVLMAQMGSFVPAARATLTPVDRVIVRMGAEDRLEEGKSTFMVEMQEAAEVFRSASPRTLVILDELGRGTSTHDGVSCCEHLQANSIAYATLHHIVRNVRCFTLFVTHYYVVCDMEQEFPEECSNGHMAFLESEGGAQDGTEITFLYKLVDGRAHRSYGLNVARLAGLEPGIISVAQERSGDLEREMRLKRTIGQVRVLLRANESDEHGEGEGRDQEALLQTWLRIQRQISSTTAR